MITGYFATVAAKLSLWWTSMSSLDMIWLGIGMFGQLMFTARWFIQWIASEKAGRSVMPLAFWIFSMAGGAMTLVYGLVRREPVIIMGQLLAVFIYARNLALIFRERDKRA